MRVPITKYTLIFVLARGIEPLASFLWSHHRLDMVEYYRCIIYSKLWTKYKIIKCCLWLVFCIILSQYIKGFPEQKKNSLIACNWNDKEVYSRLLVVGHRKYLWLFLSCFNNIIINTLENSHCAKKGPSEITEFMFFFKP